jgi:hypothetical protein
MAVLKDAKTLESHPLMAEHDVGRAHRCALRVDEPAVSSIHATLRWDPSAGWQAKDLGSKNGTFLFRRPLEQQQWHSLPLGSVLAFGNLGHTFELVDAGPPGPMLIPLDGGTPIPIERETLALPGPEQPVATVLRGQEGNWQVELQEKVIDLAQSPEFEVAGRAYRFWGAHLATTTPTAGNLGRPVQLGDFQLVFSVSRDEEHVELTLESNDERHSLPVRAHHYVLLTLARLRLEDVAQGLPETSCGWVYQDDLAGSLGVTPNKLNVDIFRLRQQVAELPIQGITQIVERRPRTGQLRTGASRLIINRL